MAQSANNQTKSISQNNKHDDSPAIQPTNHKTINQLMKVTKSMYFMSTLKVNCKVPYAKFIK